MVIEASRKGTTYCSHCGLYFNDITVDFDDDGEWVAELKNCQHMSCQCTGTRDDIIRWLHSGRVSELLTNEDLVNAERKLMSA